MHIAKKGFDNAPPLPYNKNNIEHRKGTSLFGLYPQRSCNYDPF